MLACYRVPYSFHGRHPADEFAFSIESQSTRRRRTGAFPNKPADAHLCRLEKPSDLGAGQVFSYGGDDDEIFYPQFEGCFAHVTTDTTGLE
jgi:hypothetical protein